MHPQRNDIINIRTIIFPDAVEVKSLLLEGFDIEADGAEAVVAADHCAIGVLHPPVEKVPLPTGEREDKLPHRLPGFRAQAFRTAGVDADPLLPFFYIAAMLNGILILLRKVRMRDLPERSYTYLFHRSTPLLGAPGICGGGRIVEFRLEEEILGLLQVLLPGLA